MSVRILIGDMRERLGELPDGSVDSCVTDPPYHLTSIVKRFGAANAAPAKVGKTGAYARASRGFMGQTWDGGDVAFDPATWEAVLRVLKPGAFLAAFGGTRTFHRLVCAIEDAGFEIRDTLSWNYGSGFPKSHNISKALATLPACSCGVRAEVADNNGGVINPTSPLRFGSAPVGAERVSVFSAGGAADTTGGLRLQPLSESDGREPIVQGGVKGLDRHLDPVVLGSLDVARVAEGEQIALGIGGGEVDPEALRDEMVGDKALGCTAIRAATVTGDDGCGDAGPSAALVSPSLAAPSGVATTLHPTGIVGAHTGSGTVGSGPAANEAVGLEVGGASSASEDRHTAERSTTGFKCEACGGVIRDRIPQGLGTALKPAMELICLARKPLQGTVAGNMAAHGTGALNIDGCRIDAQGRPAREVAPFREGVSYGGNALEGRVDGSLQSSKAVGTTDLGRWPANIIHDGSDEVLAAFPETTSGKLEAHHKRSQPKKVAVYGDWKDCAGTTFEGQESFGDSGSAARFFYCAKATTEERGEGNNHPTVKPIDLMCWLVRLVTPKGGTILDPFAGSGSTLIAADMEQMNAIGCELSPQYAEIAERRIRSAGGMFAEVQAA